MAKKDIPRAICDGSLVLGKIVIPCAVLEDGRRVLTQEGTLLAIGRAAKAKGGQGGRGDMKPAFLRANNLKPFIDEEISRSTTPFPFIAMKGV